MQTTSHEWCYNLNQTMQNYVHSIKKEISLFLYNKFFMNQTSHVIKSINEMDELYHSKPENNIGSDNISLEMSEPNRAGILLPLDGQEESEETLMLVMPVMLNS